MHLFLKKPYLLFLADAENEFTTAKTAVGISFWRPEWCLGQLCLTPNTVRLNLPEMSIITAKEKGAKTLIVGISSLDGTIKKDWIPIFTSAIENGFDIANGLFDKLEDIPEIKKAAEKHRVNLYDVRHYHGNLPAATGIKRSGKRLLTIGTDMCVGKMYTALALTKEMKQRNMNVDFRATGQTGIFIAEGGIALDCIINEFLTAATEFLSPDNSPDHWDVIEGQGSFLHPVGGAGLALLYGSQPDAMVLCHEPTREYFYKTENYKIPPLEQYIKSYEEFAQLTNPNAKVIGVSINTKKLENKKMYLSDLENKLGLPCVDPLDSIDSIVDVIENLTTQSK